MNKIFFPTLIIFLLLTVDGFLLNDLQLENEKFPAFKTFSLNGEEFTDEIFSEKLTVICIWTTTQENFKILSELEDLQKKFEKIKIICLVGDVQADDKEKILIAREISKKFSPNILQLTVNDDFYEILSKIKNVPTTIFIDSKKFLIGQFVSSSDSEFISREIEYILEKDSEKYAAMRFIQENIFFR